MLKKIVAYAFVAVLFTFLLVQGAIAQGVIVQLEQNFTSMTSLFLNGHEGDITMIRGLTYQSELLYEGTSIGTASGEIILLDPPYNTSVTFMDITIDGVLSFPGAGTINLTGSGIIFTSSALLRTLELALSFTGRYDAGTDVLSVYQGVGVGIGTASILTRRGSVNITMNLQSGF